MSDFLTAMAEISRARAERSRSTAPVFGLKSRATNAEPPVRLDVHQPGFDLIAEPKLRSPSEGVLEADHATPAVTGMAAGFERAGAAAISVLTEPTRFDGSLEHLAAVSSAVSVPVMRKDFLVDPIQVIEARASGASGVLLIARILDGELLQDMTDLAIDLGMFALVEVFEPSDLEIAESVFDRDVLVGVNSRDLATLGVDRTRFESMRGLLPDHLPLVAESGVHEPADAAHVARLGYRMALVGTALVAAGDREQLARSLITAGRTPLVREGAR